MGGDVGGGKGSGNVASGRVLNICKAEGILIVSHEHMLFSQITIIKHWISKFVLNGPEPKAHSFRSYLGKAYKLLCA